MAGHDMLECDRLVYGINEQQIQTKLTSVALKAAMKGISNNMS